MCTSAVGVSTPSRSNSAASKSFQFTYDQAYGLIRTRRDTGCAMFALRGSRSLLPDVAA